MYKYQTISTALAFPFAHTDYVLLVTYCQVSCYLI